MTTRLKAQAVIHRWSGHGESGEIAQVVITGVDYGLHHSTPAEIARSKADAELLNKLLDAHYQKQETP